MRIAAEHIVHFGDGRYQLVIVRVLQPFDDRSLGGTGMTAAGKGFLLLAHLLGRIQAGLRQKLVPHGEIGIDLDRFSQNLNRLLLLDLVKVEVPSLFHQTPNFRGLGRQRQYVRSLTGLSKHRSGGKKQTDGEHRAHYSQNRRS